MASTSVIESNQLRLFKNYNIFHSMSQNENESLGFFASRVTQQSLLIETFCDKDRTLQARNQILLGMRNASVRDEAIQNKWNLEELMCLKSETPQEGSEIKTEDTYKFTHGEEQEMFLSEEIEEFQEDIKEEGIEEIEEEDVIKDPLKDEGEKFTCGDCDSSYLTESALSEHRKKDYDCEVCEISPRCLKAFRLHSIQVHGLYYCHSCNTTHSSAYTLKKHRSEAHFRKRHPLTCGICSLDFPSRSVRRSHAENSCSECGICFPSREDAGKHMKAIHQRLLKNQCAICDKVLCGTYALKIHLKTMHQPDSHVFECQDCPRRFALERLLKNHVLRVHLKLREFSCKTCSKGFNSPKELQRHIDGVHEKKVASICHICSKVFYHESGLKWHIERVHEGVKRHKCESCGNEFYNRSELIKHIKAIHEKTRDFKCEYCGRSFNRKSVMIQHVKSLHTMEKNYKCSICGKTYVSKYHMTRHIKEGHEHYTRDCDICHKPFAGYGTGNLKKHKRTVHGIK